MPAEAIAAFLTEARFTKDGPVTAEQIRDAKEWGLTVTHEDYWAFADITVIGGQPRLIQFEAFEATKPEWRSLLKQIRQFGSTIGARLTQ